MVRINTVGHYAFTLLYLKVISFGVLVEYSVIVIIVSLRFFLFGFGVFAASLRRRFENKKNRKNA